MHKSKNGACSCILISFVACLIRGGLGGKRIC